MIPLLTLTVVCTLYEELTPQVSSTYMCKYLPQTFECWRSPTQRLHSTSEKCPLKTRLPYNQSVAWCRGLPTWSKIVCSRLTDFPWQAMGWHLDSELIVLDSLWPVGILTCSCVRVAKNLQQPFFSVKRCNIQSGPNMQRGHGTSNSTRFRTIYLVMQFYEFGRHDK